jgi:hypothetical protein
MGPREITIMLGEAWRKLPEAEKKVITDFLLFHSKIHYTLIFNLYMLISQSYHDLVTQAFVQWQEDMKAYQAVSINIK